jgi:hypothetical protein
VIDHSISLVCPTRSVPPQPNIAWFVRDLVPDEIWQTFDIGVVDAGDVATVRQALLAYGGRDAWLRLVVQVRMELPNLLSVSISDMFNQARTRFGYTPPRIVIQCRPDLSVHIGGCLIRPPIRLNCRATIDLVDPDPARNIDYLPADTELTVAYDKHPIMANIKGRYLVRAGV